MNGDEKVGISSLAAGFYDDHLDHDKDNKNHQVIAGRIIGTGSFVISPELEQKVLPVVSAGSVIHSHGLWSHSGIIARRIAETKRVPMLISPHGMLEPWALNHASWKKWFARHLFENRNLRTAVCLHALSKTEALDMRDYGLLNPICIIPNGIDPPPQLEPVVLENEISYLIPIVGNRKLLLYLGRLHPKKGLKQLIHAWSLVQNNQNGLADNWVLGIAGWDQNGHEMELKQLCSEVGLNSYQIRTNISTKEIILEERLSDSLRNISVLFLGPQFGNSKAALYSYCNAFILPSYSEGIPLVLLEAWMYSKPLLMTPACNLSIGLKAKAALPIETSVESVAAGLSQLFVMSDTERDEMGQRGRELVKTNFTWAKIAEEMHTVYQWILDGGTTPKSVYLA